MVVLNAGHPSVAERIRAGIPELAPAERRVARAVLAGYPMAGLDTVAALADRAGTSAPTVLRLLTKLGFEGYPDFQRALRSELSARLAGPAELYETPAAPPAASLVAAVSGALDELPAGEIAAAAGLLSDVRRPVVLVGGRWSGLLARFLALHLRLLRPGISEVGPEPGDRAGSLLDLDRRSVVVAFDFRRYQPDTVAFGRAASAAGASLVLFTDHLLSPLAADADVVLATESLAAGSPFTLFTPAMAAVELLVAELVGGFGAGPRDRLARYDELSAQLQGER